MVSYIFLKFIYFYERLLYNLDTYEDIRDNRSTVFEVLEEEPNDLLFDNNQNFDDENIFKVVVSPYVAK